MTLTSLSVYDWFISLAHHIRFQRAFALFLVILVGLHSTWDWRSHSDIDWGDYVNDLCTCNPSSLVCKSLPTRGSSRAGDHAHDLLDDSDVVPASPASSSSSSTQHHHRVRPHRVHSGGGSSSSPLAVDASSSSPPLSGSRHRTPATFSKFIWLVVDGHPRFLADDLFEHYAENSLKYTFRVPGFKDSFAIYTSWITGRQAKNFARNPIRGDFIFDALRRSWEPCAAASSIAGGSSNDSDPSSAPSATPSSSGGGGGGGGGDGYHTLDDYKRARSWNPVKIVYEGPRGMVDIAAGPDRDDWAYMQQVTIVDESDYMSKSARVFDSLTPERLDQLLGVCVREGASMIAYTETFDKMQHYRRKRLEQQAFRVNQVMLPLREWVDAHPDYLLILSSDHGIDTLRGMWHELHGDGRYDNIGYMLMYNPRLPTAVEREIDVVDVAPTLSVLFGVDFPFYSEGVFQNYFGSEHAYERAYKATLMRNIAQLQDLVEFKGHSWTIAHDTEGLAALTVDQLKEVADHLKGKLYKRDYQFPFAQVAVLVTALVLLGAYFAQQYAEMSLVEWFWVPLLFGPSFVAFMYLKWDLTYTGLHQQGVMWELSHVSVVTALLLRDYYLNYPSYRAAPSWADKARRMSPLWGMVLFIEALNSGAAHVQSMLWVACENVAVHTIVTLISHVIAGFGILRSVEIGSRMKATLISGLLLSLAYHNTAQSSMLYLPLVSGVHVFSLATLLVVLGAGLALLVRRSKGLHLPILSLLIFLNPHNVSLLLVTWQYTRLLIPFFERHGARHRHRHDDDDDDDDDDDGAGHRVHRRARKATGPSTRVSSASPTSVFPRAGSSRGSTARGMRRKHARVSSLGGSGAPADAFAPSTPGMDVESGHAPQHLSHSHSGGAVPTISLLGDGDGGASSRTRGRRGADARATSISPPSNSTLARDSPRASSTSSSAASSSSTTGPLVGVSGGGGGGGGASAAAPKSPKRRGGKRGHTRQLSLSIKSRVKLPSRSEGLKHSRSLANVVAHAGTIEKLLSPRPSPADAHASMMRGEVVVQDDLVMMHAFLVYIFSLAWYAYVNNMGQSLDWNLPGASSGGNLGVHALLVADKFGVFVLCATLNARIVHHIEGPKGMAWLALRSIQWLMVLLVYYLIMFWFSISHLFDEMLAVAHVHAIVFVVVLALLLIDWPKTYNKPSTSILIGGGQR